MSTPHNANNPNIQSQSPPNTSSPQADHVNHAHTPSHGPVPSPVNSGADNLQQPPPVQYQPVPQQPVQAQQPTQTPLGTPVQPASEPMDDGAKKQAFDQAVAALTEIKTILEHEKLGINDIEHHYMRAMQAYQVCQQRIQEVGHLIESGKQAASR